MKDKITRKKVRETYGNANIYSIGNCNLQYLLKYLSPFAYSTRVEGWACDYYDVGKGIILCDGYAPIGKKVDFDTMRFFDEKAREIWEEYHYTDYEKCERLITNMLADFIGTIKGGN